MLLKLNLVLGFMIEYFVSCILCGSWITQISSLKSVSSNLPTFRRRHLLEVTAPRCSENLQNMKKKKLQQVVNDSCHYKRFAWVLL